VIVAATVLPPRLQVSMVEPTGHLKVKVGIVTLNVPLPLPAGAKVPVDGRPVVVAEALHPAGPVEVQELNVQALTENGIPVVAVVCRAAVEPVQVILGFSTPPELVIVHAPLSVPVIAVPLG
jgi:hypothetical protein